MKQMTLKERAKRILKILKQTYPNATIELNYKKNDYWQLLVVVSLSAQTTDKKVNEVSPALFKQFKSIHDFAKASPSDIEPYIKTLGLYKGKAKNLVHAARKIIAEYNGFVPKKRDELESLPGVGKKTSAVIVSAGFNEPAIPVDTHVARVSRRLGLTKNLAPHKIERDLTHIIPMSDQILAHHALIFHGRRICFAKKPHCSLCPLKEICPQIGVTISN